LSFNPEDVYLTKCVVGISIFVYCLKFHELSTDSSDNTKKKILSN
jgi:hypothetical protein